MKAYIFGASEIKDYSYIDKEDLKNSLIICADGGITHLEMLNIKPDVIIGDFDSSKKQSEFKNIIEYPVEKDDTDLCLSINYAAEHGCSKCIAIGCLGGRLDHTFANISLLYYAKTKGVDLELIDEKTRVFLVSSYEVIKKEKYKYVSVFPFNDTAEGITLKGFKYSLNSAKLTFDFPLGISNEIVASYGEITVKKGNIIVMMVKE